MRGVRGPCVRGVAAPVAAKPAVSAAGQTFESADKAVAALVGALRTERLDALARVLGPGSRKLIYSGDPYADAAARRKFLAAYDLHHELVAAGPGRIVLQVGKNGWPMPIPIVEAHGRWHFDSRAGAQEIVDRRIGRNEIAAIRTALAYVDAQKAYFAMAGEYARRLVSSPGKRDGLYWPSSEGEPESPLAPLVAQAIAEGYPGELVSGKLMPYQGYFYRILTAQGADTPEGAIDYIANGRMTKGFALVAWPASYGASGIMTFIVNQAGIVFQRDLGPHTTAIASAMKLFAPDLSWTRVDIVN
jgi:hypothetical protein